MLLALVGVLSSAVVVVVLVLARRGLSALDESYVLWLTADPQATRVGGEVYVYGFLLHPVLVALRDDVFGFRVVGILGLAGLAGALAHQTLRVTYTGGRAATPAQQVVVVLTTGAASTLAFTYANRLPSYTSVALAGLVIATIGMARLALSAEVSGGALVGAGGWLTFTGKPTSALGLLLVCCIGAAFLRRLTPRVTVSALGTGMAAAAVTLALMRLGPLAFVGYLRRGLRQVQLLGDHGKIDELVGLVRPDLLALLVFGCIFCLVFGWGFWALRQQALTRPDLALAVIVAGLLAVSAAVVWIFARDLAGLAQGQRMLSLGLVLPVATLAVAFTRRRGRVRTAGRRPEPSTVVIVVLVVMPYVYALGTNLPFSLAMANASLFWSLALAAVVLVRHGVGAWATRLLVVTLGLSLAVTATLVATSVVDGGPRGSLAASVTPTKVLGGVLLMTPAHAKVLDQLTSVRRDFGLTDRTPVVDLTGFGPGYAMQLGGVPLGRAFFMGIFPGVVASAEYALSLEPCEERAKAWLLVASDDSFSVAPAFTHFGVDLFQDYDVVTTFAPQQGIDAWRSVEVRVLRPRDSVPVKMGCPQS